MQTKSTATRARIEPAIKAKAKKIFAKVGLSESEAIRLFYHHSVLTGGIPFDLRIPNAETRAAMKEVDKGIYSKGYTNIDEMFADLKK
ncbi:MAG: type II toxin-antitoxin system RelB/DinJ family antitoxin [Melioribacteraceae bacterium]